MGRVKRRWRVRRGGRGGRVIVLLVLCEESCNVTGIRQYCLNIACVFRRNYQRSIHCGVRMCPCTNSATLSRRRSCLGNVVEVREPTMHVKILIGRTAVLDIYSL